MSGNYEMPWEVTTRINEYALKKVGPVDSGPIMTHSDLHLEFNIWSTLLEIAHKQKIIDPDKITQLVREAYSKTMKELGFSNWNGEPLHNFFTDQALLIWHLVNLSEKLGNTNPIGKGEYPGRKN